MIKQTTRLVLIVISLFLLFACDTSKKVDLELEVNVTLDGKPSPQAKIVIDGTPVGETDGSGHFLQKLQGLPGAEVKVTVEKKATGYRIDPWSDSFVTKLTKKGAVERYSFKADLKATRYFTLVVDDNGQPVTSADVFIQGKSVAQTDQSGEYVHEYRKVPERGLKVSVAKKGYTTWQKTIKVKPGQRYEVTLETKTVAKAPVKVKVDEAPKVATAPVPVAPAPVPQPKKAKPKIKKATVYVAALTERYGVSKGLPSVSVYINDKKVGKTNSKGFYTYGYKGKPIEEARVKLSAKGYLPQEWETSIPLKGKRRVQHYFYPAKPRPIRVGIYGYVNNSPDEDLSEVLDRVEEAIGNNLFIYGGFHEVPKDKLRDMILKAGLDMETVSTKGWLKTSLLNSVDMIIYGSVTKDDSGFTIESTVLTSDGSIILSQINRARKEKNIKNTAKLIVGGIVDQFPFEGTVEAVEDEGYRINLGNLDYNIRRGSKFKYMTAELDRSGRLKGYREAGLLRVVQTDDSTSLLEVVDLEENAEINIGDRVIRRIYLDEKRETEKASAILLVKGGVVPDERPLWGVNVYINNTWVGTTGSNGKVEIPISLYEENDILLSRHGYQQVRDTVSVGEDKQIKEFVLDVASAVFKVESEPSGADVYVDGVNIGKTPILEGELVNFGFRKIKLTAGGDYRDWEKVVEFNKPEVDRTGAAKIVFLKDYLVIGKKAERKGNIDAAIAAYASTEKGNPDYSQARSRLGQLYMDEKNEYGSAIREFENVLTLPANRQIIYKQYAVAYTNLGHAYYEKGRQLVAKDRRAAAGNFAKAIRNLSIAKQNTRFFPSNHYDEAVHDTYYYMALSYHKLFLVTKKRTLIHKADLAWREYFDFFPKKLEKKSTFVSMRSGAEKYWNQIKDLK